MKKAQPINMINKNIMLRYVVIVVHNLVLVQEAKVCETRISSFFEGEITVKCFQYVG